MRAALVGLALVACSRSERVQPPSSGTPSTPIASDAAALGSPIPASTPQLVVGVVDDWTATRVTLQRFRRDGAAWQLVGAPWPGVVGRTGVAWGDGLHGNGVPAGREGPIKREGDGKSPAGVFAMLGSYGYATAPPAGTQLAYTALGAEHQCVDDVRSQHYNRIVDKRRVDGVDWDSFEVMRRSDELYEWVVELAHNAAHVPARGSCIFLHVWGGPDTTTSGCTAMAEAELAQLVATLPPSTVFVLLPRTEYDALRSRWGLPGL